MRAIISAKELRSSAISSAMRLWGAGMLVDGDQQGLLPGCQVLVGKGLREQRLGRKWARRNRCDATWVRSKSRKARDEAGRRAVGREAVIGLSME